MDMDREFKKFTYFAAAWFIFVALLGVGLIGGGVYVAYKLLAHFGVLG